MTKEQTMYSLANAVRSLFELSGVTHDEALTVLGVIAGYYLAEINGGGVDEDDATLQWFDFVEEHVGIALDHRAQAEAQGATKQ